jgi:CheY-like chemotaxis protein
MNDAITILVYHPNKILLQRLVQFIQAGGYNTLSTSDDSEAVRLACEMKPEVFLVAPLAKADLDAAEEVQKRSWTSVVVLADTDDVAAEAQSIGIDQIVMYDGSDIGNILESIRRLFPDRNLPEPTQEGACVLVVDDEPDAVEMLTEFLVRSGYRALGAGTGSEGLDILKRDEGVDVVLLDIHLPDIGGIQVLRAITELHHPPGVIILTALRDSIIAQHALRLGACDFLTKPIDLKLLDESITACLARMEYRERHWWNRRQTTRPA